MKKNENNRANSAFTYTHTYRRIPTKYDIRTPAHAHTLTYGVTCTYAMRSEAAAHGPNAKKRGRRRSRQPTAGTGCGDESLPTVRLDGETRIPLGKVFSQSEAEPDEEAGGVALAENAGREEHDDGGEEERQRSTISTR